MVVCCFYQSIMKAVQLVSQLFFCSLPYVIAPCHIAHSCQVNEITFPARENSCTFLLFIYLFSLFFGPKGGSFDGDA